MHIATIRSRIVTKLDNDETGYFVTQVQVSMRDAAASGDPKGFIQKTISEHLAVAIHSTGLPLNEGLWEVEFSQFALNNFSFPKGFTA